MRCVNHPNLETAVRCGRCGDPVCPKCSVFGPAGIRCRSCAFPKGAALLDMPAGQMAVVVGVGLGAAVVAGYLLALISGIGFFTLFGGLLLGSAVGEVFLRVGGHRRGPQMTTAAGLCAGLGALIGFGIWWVWQMQAPADPSAMLRYLTGSIFYLAGIAAAVFGAVSRVRYL